MKPTALLFFVLACHSKSVPDAGGVAIASAAPSEIASVAPSAFEAPIASASVSASASIAAPAPKPSADPLQASKDEEETRRQILQAFGNGASSGLPLTGGSGKAWNPPPRSGPPPRADVVTSVMNPDSVSNAERTVASMRAGFRACYSKGLEADPNMIGQLRARVKISPAGEVNAVTTDTKNGVSANVEQCALRRMRLATFDAPGVDGAMITVTLTFRLLYGDMDR